MIDNVPSLMVVAPVKVLVPDSVNVPEPFLIRLPEPEITPAKLVLSEWLKASVPLSTMARTIEPVVPPSPI